MPMLKILDLFCGAGGASHGYALAGFEVTGIDIKHGKRYPYTYMRRVYDPVGAIFKGSGWGKDAK